MAVSAGFQLHSCTSLDVIDLFCQVERCATHVAKTLPSKQPGCDSSGWRQALAPGDAACSIAGQVSSRTLRSSPPYDLLLQPWACSGVHIYSSVSSQLKKSSAPLQRSAIQYFKSYLPMPSDATHDLSQLTFIAAHSFSRLHNQAVRRCWSGTVLHIS